MASQHRKAITAFIARNSGPAGDTKYDIFNQAGLSRGQLRRNRTVRPKAYRNYKPTTRTAPGETV